MVVLSLLEPSTGWFWAVQVLGAILPFLQSMGLLVEQFSLDEQWAPLGGEPVELNAGALGETPLVNTKNPNEGWSLAEWSHSGAVPVLWDLCVLLFT